MSLISKEHLNLALQSIKKLLSGKVDKSEVESFISNKMNTIDPVGSGSFSMNRKAGTTIGSYSYAEGYNATASGSYSHAGGNLTTASGYASYAEGSSTKASGHCSHAEGDLTTASGYASHTEGGITKASGSYSHAEGLYTIAASESQHAQGKYNIGDASSKYAHIVGNGTNAANRSNAHTLDWDGIGWYKGGLKVGGTGQDDEAAQEVATKDYVVDLVGDTKVSEQISTAIQESVADWNQNDPTAADYIKNRPFYSGDWKDLYGELSDGYKNTTYGLASTMWEYVVTWETNIFECYPSGTTCKVVVDGKEYVGTITDHGYFGNGALMSSTFADTGESFCVQRTGLDCFGVTVLPELSESPMVSIFVLDGEPVHKLDAKYLPDEIVTDWSQTDPTAVNYIKNKPSTVEGYGITELPVNLLSGTISIENLPHGALERCVVVLDDIGRLELTKDNVQNGDTVKEELSGKMYFVVDDTKLNSNDGYIEYTAGTASSVAWSGVTSKPNTLSGYGITDAVNTNDVTTTATANKLLKLNNDAKLPADITGNAASASEVEWSGIQNVPTGLNNLFANNMTILTLDSQYGDTLPAAGNPGRIFFKKVSS